MDASYRLLLCVISNIVFNKSGILAYGSEPKFLTIACFLQQQPICIPYLMMRRMESCARKISPLLYAAFISKIVTAFNINPHFHNQEGSSIIGSNSLRGMNFSLIGNQWRRIGENLTTKRARERRESEINVDEMEDEMDDEEEEAEAIYSDSHGNTDFLLN